MSDVTGQSRVVQSGAGKSSNPCETASNHRVYGMEVAVPTARFGPPSAKDFQLAKLFSRDRFDQFHRLDAQRVRQFDDVEQTYVPFAPFDSADVVSMQVRQLRQALLRKAELRPQFANASAE